MFVGFVQSAPSCGESARSAEAGSRSGTRFELVYGASGALAGIPILISYQPKWWLQVDLVLKS